MSFCRPTFQIEVIPSICSRGFSRLPFMSFVSLRTVCVGACRRLLPVPGTLHEGGRVCPPLHPQQSNCHLQALNKYMSKKRKCRLAHLLERSVLESGRAQTWSDPSRVRGQLFLGKRALAWPPGLSWVHSGLLGKGCPGLADWTR